MFANQIDVTIDKTKMVQTFLQELYKLEIFKGVIEDGKHTHRNDGRA